MCPLCQADQNKLPRAFNSLIYMGKGFRMCILEPELIAEFILLKYIYLEDMRPSFKRCMPSPVSGYWLSLKTWIVMIDSLMASFYDTFRDRLKLILCSLFHDWKDLTLTSFHLNGWWLCRKVVVSSLTMWALTLCFSSLLSTFKDEVFL